MSFGKITDAQRKSWAADLWRDANKESFFKPLQGNVLLVTPWQRFKARLRELFVRRPRDAWQILWHGRYVLTDTWLDEYDRVSIQLVEEE